jgi:hypothetical protein
LDLILLLLLHFDLHIFHFFSNIVSFLLVVLGNFGLENVGANGTKSFNIALNLFNRFNRSFLQRVRLHHDRLLECILNKSELILDVRDFSGLLASAMSLVIDDCFLSLILTKLQHVLKSLNDLVSAVISGENGLKVCFIHVVHDK